MTTLHLLILALFPVKIGVTFAMSVLVLCKFLLSYCFLNPSVYLWSFVIRCPSKISIGSLTSLGCKILVSQLSTAFWDLSSWLNALTLPSETLLCDGFKEKKKQVYLYLKLYFSVTLNLGRRDGSTMRNVLTLRSYSILLAFGLIMELAVISIAKMRCVTD